MKSRYFFSTLAGVAMAVVLFAVNGLAQQVRSLTSNELTVDKLVNVLMPKGPQPRGIGLKPPVCTHFHEQASRGIELEPKADIAAISVEFETNSATLKPEAEKTLDTLSEALDSAELKPCCFQIQGYTDSTGGRRLNQRLSQARAESVTKYLAQRGIDQQRMMSKGFGPARPIATNATPQGRAKNRRVQVVNLGYGTEAE
jgi:outer membrane protein OmpA-like peptidoglycan-associated protein